MANIPRRELGLGIAAAMFCAGQPGLGAAYLAGTVPAFVLAKYLTKKLWEEPPSLL